MQHLFKILMLVLLVQLTISSKAQVLQPSGLPTTNSPNSWSIVRGTYDTMQMFFERDTNFLARFPTLIKGIDHNFYFSNGSGGKWFKLVDTAGIHAAIVALQNGKVNYSDSTITFVTPTQGDNRYVQIQTQNPGALIYNQYYQLELMSSGSDTLNNIISKSIRYAANNTQKSTATIVSNILTWNNGSNSSSPTIGIINPGDTATYYIPTYVHRNTNTTYIWTVTTSDSKTAVVTSTVNWYPKYYIGYSATSSPSDADLIAGVNSFLNTTGSRVISGGTLANPASSSYIFFAVPSSQGTPVVTINAAGVNYNNTTRTVVNSGGYSQSYIISVSPFPTASGVTYKID